MGFCRMIHGRIQSVKVWRPLNSNIIIRIIGYVSIHIWQQSNWTCVDPFGIASKPDLYESLLELLDWNIMVSNIARVLWRT